MKGLCGGVGRPARVAACVRAELKTHARCRRAAARGGEETNLEKRLRMRPAGVVSKKLIGDRKMAKAILSWSLRDAYGSRAYQPRELMQLGKPSNTPERVPGRLGTQQ